MSSFPRNNKNVLCKGERTVGSRVRKEKGVRRWADGLHLRRDMEGGTGGINRGVRVVLIWRGNIFCDV